MKTIVHGIPLAQPEGCSSSRAAPRFAFVGRLVTSKGVRILLHAAKALKDQGIEFGVDIVGKGPDRESLEALTHELQLDQLVHFFGYIEDGQLSQIVDSAAAVIMPSLAGEVFGLSAAENMSRGKLVIASNIGSLSEVVGDAGMTFPAGDSVALASLMREVVLHPTMVEEFGRKARSRIYRDFSWETMANDHYALYEEIMFT
jgi:glycosyltransferase involved in cell wall biosynthesis